MVRNATVIYFSPTGATKKIALQLCSDMGISDIEKIDLTKPCARDRRYRIDSDLVILGAPVYEEYLPEYVVSSIKKMEFNNQPVFAFAVYGNIGYGMSLIQYYEELNQKNLLISGLSAFIGEHSFSTSVCELARGRPDLDDYNEINEIAKEVMKRIYDGRFIGSRDGMPGSLPLMARILPKGSARLFTKPPNINDRCNNCGLCVKNCPVAAINADLSIEEVKCIRCFACVKNCRRNGRKIEYRFSPLVRLMLRSNDKQRKRSILV